MLDFLVSLLHGHAAESALSAAVAAWALLWLGASLGQAAGARALAGAVLLLATGLWWPGQWLGGQAAGALSDGWQSARSFAGMAALAATLVAAAHLLRQRTPWLAAVPALLALPLGAWVLAPLVGQTAWPVPPAALPRLGLAGVGAVLVGAVMLAPMGPGRSGLLLRGLSTALTAAALLVAVTGAQPLAGLPAAPAPWPQLLPLAALLGLGLLLLRLVADSQAPSGAPSTLPEADRPSQLSRLQPEVDALTQLPTRTYFEQRLGREVGRCDTHSGRLALLFIDLDGFKPVNDTFGHSSGDLVLEQVGERLKGQARNGIVVARVGGDEFLMLVPGNPTVEGVSRQAQRLIEALGQPYRIEAREVSISCSIGVVFYPDNGAHTKLIARADAAMYSAKRAGGSCYAFYTPEMDADAREQFDLLRDLRKALENNELELFYQPKIDARSGQVTAAEALLRWRHPTRGLIMPGVFIPVAERFGLIGAVGNWVIDRAAQQARDWREAGLRMRVAINLSAQQMRQDDIVDRIVGALEKHRIQPSLFTCEITETVAMEDTRATQNTLRRMGEAGLHLSIDDFGTGYSSLAYLRRLPAEELKIDRSFVKDVEQSNDARAVVDAVVKLAHALGLRVVAEGVETQRQQQILLAMGCDELQGYLFAKPMSARALLLWAMDERSQREQFRPSLFGETLPVR